MLTLDPSASTLPPEFLISGVHFGERMRSHERSIEAFSDRLEVLLKKRDSTAHVLDQTLSFQQQQAAQKQSETTIDLAKTTVHESVSVRVITAITLVYLSCTAPAVRTSLSSRSAVLAHGQTGYHGHPALLQE